MNVRAEVERLDGNKVGYRVRNQCPKLVNGLCSIHETKPKICKDGKIGSQWCLNAVLKFRNKKQQDKIIELINLFNA